MDIFKIVLYCTRNANEQYIIGRACLESVSSIRLKCRFCSVIVRHVNK